MTDLNNHRDIEILVDELVRRQRDLSDIEAYYVGAEHSEVDGWLRAEHESRVAAEHEADQMLDAALDEVFEQTFNAVTDEKCSQCRSVHEWGCGYCKDYDEACD